MRGAHLDFAPARRRDERPVWRHQRQDQPKQWSQTRRTRLPGGFFGTSTVSSDYQCMGTRLQADSSPTPHIWIYGRCLRLGRKPQTCPTSGGHPGEAPGVTSLFCRRTRQFSSRARKAFFANRKTLCANTPLAPKWPLRESLLRCGIS